MSQLCVSIGIEERHTAFPVPFMVSLVLGQYRGEELVYKGHVTLGVSGTAFAQIKALPPTANPPFYHPAGHGNEQAVWLAPVLVGTVEFMHRTKGGGMRQPLFKGLRLDKLPKECLER